jgi:hypothetical protein
MPFTEEQRGQTPYQSDNSSFPRENPAPFVWIYPVIDTGKSATVGNEPISLENGKPSKVLAFRYEKLVNGVGPFQLLVADETWVVVEEAIKQGRGLIELKYGYTSKRGGGKGATTSLLLRARVIGYKLIKLEFGMMSILIEGIALGFSLSFNQRYKANNKGENLAVFIKRILMEDNHFPESSIVIQETINSKTMSDLKMAKEELDRTNLYGETLAQYLNRVVAIMPYDEKIGRYVWFVDQDVNNPSSIGVFYFGTIDFVRKQKAIKNGNKDSVRRYFVFNDKNTEVKSYVPSSETSLLNTVGSKDGVVFTGGLNTLTGLPEEQKLGSANAKVAVVGDNKTEEASNKPKNSYATCVYTPFDSKSNQTVSAQSLANAYYAFPITATLEILGDVSLRLLDIIEVYVDIPVMNKYNKTGNPHWTSGQFVILGIEEEITDQGYITHLSLGTTGRENRNTVQVKIEQSEVI